MQINSQYQQKVLSVTVSQKSVSFVYGDQSGSMPHTNNAASIFEAVNDIKELVNYQGEFIDFTM